ncbi:MAG: hypothetical protein GY702_21060, partial [Desulfobulbaceae bacterium]|nr:hypothetical protein [Desulfobulbaceae bacterium]
MAYKNIKNYFSFADIDIEKNADNNRSFLFLHKIDNSIDWEPVEHLLILGGCATENAVLTTSVPYSGAPHQNTYEPSSCQ